MYYFAPGSGEKKNHFASLFSLEERGNLITSCRSWLLLSVAQRRAVSQWRESILVSELLSGGCRETVVSSCWGHPVSLCSMLAHPSSSSSKGGPGLAGRVEWRSWCFRENKYCFLVFITSACDYFSPFFFFAVFTDCPLISPWTCHTLSDLCTRSFKFKGIQGSRFCSVLTLKKRGYCRHFLMMFNLHKCTYI